jgi:3-oxoacyl-[acyl-carrier-protein] synthase III
MSTPVITGLGHYLPERVVLNEELADALGWEAGDIEQRTGISSRRWVDGRVYTSDLAVGASKSALESAELCARDVDCIILSTQTPDHANPGTGVAVQVKLGLKDIPCYDIRNQCSGFLYALQMARCLVIAGQHQRVLVVCAELHSHGLGRSPKHAHVTPLFGDGAGAVVVEAQRKRSPISIGVSWLRVHADGAGASRLGHRLWDISFEPPWDLSQGDEDPEMVRYPHMDGEYVFRRAVRKMANVARDCLSELQLTPADIDFVAPHQANSLILKTLVSILEVPEAKLLTNLASIGNTSSASIPILLSEAFHQDKLSKPARVLCLAFGAGFTWGGALLQVGHDH